MMTGEVRVYNQRTVLDRDFVVGENYISKEKYEELRPFTIYPGDVLLTTRGTIGKCVVVPEDAELGVLHPCLMRIQPDPSRILPKYLMRLIQDSILVQTQLALESNATTIEVIYSETIRAIKIPLPSLQEQCAIAAFLDQETARIDALVAKKERLLELLQEKRTALITQAVTKGLDPNVPMKNSGVEWIGEMPTRWDVAPLYSCYEVALGKMLDSKRISGKALGPYIRNVDVQWDRVAVDNLPEMDFEPHERQRHCLRIGDLLVCEGGEVGRTAMWKGELDECYYQKAVHRLRPLSSKEVPRFFYWVMFANAKAGRFSAQGNPNTIDHLTAVQLKRYRFAFPPSKEQAVIAQRLDNETARIDALTLKIRQATSLLKEYRTALISAAVTGKINVSEKICGQDS